MERITDGIWKNRVGTVALRLKAAWSAQRFDSSSSSKVFADGFHQSQSLRLFLKAQDIVMVPRIEWPNVVT